MKDTMKRIKAIEDRYDYIVFRMSLTHLLDTGMRNFDEKNVEKYIMQINAKGEKDKAKGVTTILSPEFQCVIIRCAAELSVFSPLEIFAYVKEHVFISIS